MQRKIMEDLYQWYKCEDKKILILKGNLVVEKHGQ